MHNQFNTSFRGGAPLQQKWLPTDTGAATGKALLPCGQLSPEPTRRTGPSWGQWGYDQAAMKSQEDLQVKREVEHRAYKGRLTRVAWASLNGEGQGNSIPLPSATPRETQEEMQTDYLQKVHSDRMRCKGYRQQTTTFQIEKELCFFPVGYVTAREIFIFEASWCSWTRFEQEAALCDLQMSFQHKLLLDFW